MTDPVHGAAVFASYETGHRYRDTGGLSGSANRSAYSATKRALLSD